MLKTQKFNQKNITDGGVKALSVVTGMMAGGALESLIPVKFQKGNDVILTLAGSAIAIGLTDSSTPSTVVKYAGLGIAARSLYNVVSDQVRKVVPVKAEGEELTMVDKIVQGAVGLSNPMTHGSFLASPTINFDRYREVESADSVAPSASSFLN
jgi:hypothetical protein